MVKYCNFNGVTSMQVTKNELWEATMDFFTDNKSVEVMGANRVSECGAYFLALTVFPGNTAYYSFKNSYDLFKFAYRLFSSVCGEHEGLYNKRMKSLESAQLQQLRINAKTHLDVPTAFCFHHTDYFPRIDFGTHSQLEFFDSHYDSFMNLSALQKDIPIPTVYL